MEEFASDHAVIQEKITARMLLRSSSTWKARHKNQKALNTVSRDHENAP